jgi:hypothetical protein
MSAIYTSLLVILYALAAIPCMGQEQPTANPLTPAEADAIVSQQMADREQQRQAKVAELESATVIESFEADLGDRKVVFNRVVPGSGQTTTTAKAASVTMAKASSDALSQAEIVRLSKEVDSRENFSIFLNAEVFSGPVSELRWQYKGKEYVAYANVDFKYFSGLSDFESTNAHYSVLLAASDGSRARLKNSASGQWVPSIEDFSAEGIEYLVLEDQASEDDSAYGVIAAMLSYYAEHESEMIVSYQRAEALREAKKRYLEANPPQPRDTIINFSPIPESKSLQTKR